MSNYVPSENERQYYVARLGGYLDAIASINGSFREYVAGAVLLAVDSGDVDSAICNSLGKWSRPMKLVELRRGTKWTEVEAYLRGLFLSEPFGEKSLSDLPQLSNRRVELAFQATDLVSSLAEDFQPKGIFHLVMTNEMAVVANGCAIEYDNDVLLLVNVQWRRDV